MIKPMKCEGVLLDCNKKMDAVLEVTESMTEMAEPNRVIDSVIYRLGRQLGYVFPAVFLLDAQRRSLVIKKIGVKPDSFKLLKKQIDGKVQDIRFPLTAGKNLAVRAFLKNRMMTSEKLSELMRPVLAPAQSLLLAEHLNIEKVAVVPISHKHRSIGVLAVFLHKKDIKDSEIILFQTFAGQISVAMHTAGLYQQLQRQNRQLNNQRHFLASANERLHALDEVKSEFITIASHKLRTPLTSIRGFLSMLLDGSVGECDETAEEILKKISSSTERLHELVDELLNASEMEKGVIDLDKHLARLEDLAAGQIDEFREAAANKGLKLTFHQPRRPMPKVRVDEEKIKGVIYSLLDNAVKYTPQGKIDVFVKRIDHQIGFIVKDTGVGLNEDLQSRLFNKFERGRGAANVYTEGVGLGLFVAKRIINAHEGNIRAFSKGKGKGSEFVFTLPVASKSVL